jgi:chromosome segregation ATPase
LDYWQLGNYNRSNYHHNIKHHPQVKRIANIHAFIERVKEQFKTDYSEIKHFERRLAQVDNDIRKVMKLYRLDAIDEREIEIEMLGLQEQKRALSASLEEAGAMQRGLEVSTGEIIQVIENFREEVRHAGPTIRKRALQALFGDIRIHPKQGSPWERIVEIRGTKVPLTRVNVASPRGLNRKVSKAILLKSPLN